MARTDSAQPVLPRIGVKWAALGFLVVVVVAIGVVGMAGGVGLAVAFALVALVVPILASPRRVTATLSKRMRDWRHAGSEDTSESVARLSQETFDDTMARLESRHRAHSLRATPYRDDITLIVPAYNQENWISAALTSVLNQSVPNWRLVIVDDGSTDDTLARVHEFALAAPERVEVVSNKKSAGPGAARNIGLERVTTRYVGFLDSDDQLMPDYVASVLGQFEASGGEVGLFAFFDYWDGTNSLSANENAPASGLSPHTPTRFPLTAETAFQRLTPAVWNKAYCAEFLRNSNAVFPVDPLLHEDVPWTYSLMLQAKTAWYVPQPLYRYTRRDDSMVSKRFNSALPLLMTMRELRNRVEPLLTSDQRYLFDDFFLKQCENGHRVGGDAFMNDLRRVMTEDGLDDLLFGEDTSRVVQWLEKS